MPRGAAALVLPLILAACASTARLDARGLERKLERSGFADESVADPRCRAGAEGWDFVCTYRRGRDVGRTKAAFLVDGDRIEAATAPLALDLPIGPAPGTANGRAWAAFTRSASRLCVDRRRRIAELPPARTRAQFTARFAAALALQRRTLRRLSDVVPPSGYRQKFRAYLDSERRLLAVTTRYHRARVRGDAGAVYTAASDARVAARGVDRAARAVGLTACTQTR